MNDTHSIKADVPTKEDEEWGLMCRLSSEESQRHLYNVVWLKFFPRFWERRPELKPPVIRCEKFLRESRVRSLITGVAEEERKRRTQTIATARSRVTETVTNQLKSINKMRGDTWASALHLLAYEEFRKLSAPPFGPAIIHAMTFDSADFFVRLGNKLQKKPKSLLEDLSPKIEEGQVCSLWADPITHFLINYWADFERLPLSVLPDKDIAEVYEASSSGALKPHTIRKRVSQLKLQR